MPGQIKNRQICRPGKKRGSKWGLTRRDGFLQDLEELSGRLVIHDHHNFRPKKRKLGKNGKMFRSEEWDWKKWSPEFESSGRRFDSFWSRSCSKNDGWTSAAAAAWSRRTDRDVASHNKSQILLENLRTIKYGVSKDWLQKLRDKTFWDLRISLTLYHKKCQRPLN